jgi:hypothetical protein
MPAGEIGLHRNAIGVHRCGKQAAAPEPDIIVPALTLTSKPSSVSGSFSFSRNAALGSSTRKPTGSSPIRSIPSVDILTCIEEHERGIAETLNWSICARSPSRSSCLRATRNRQGG